MMLTPSYAVRAVFSACRQCGCTHDNLHVSHAEHARPLAFSASVCPDERQTITPTEISVAPSYKASKEGFKRLSAPCNDSCSCLTSEAGRVTLVQGSYTRGQVFFSSQWHWSVKRGT